MPTCHRFLVGGDCIFVKTGRAGKSVSTLFGVLPRRFSSSSVAACIKSNSSSLKCLTALRRFLGRTYRRGSLSVASSVADNAEAVAVVNRSGAVRSIGLRPMASACRRQRQTAISIERKWCCRKGFNCEPPSSSHWVFATWLQKLLVSHPLFFSITTFGSPIHEIRRSGIGVVLLDHRNTGATV